MDLDEEFESGRRADAQDALNGALDGSAASSSKLYRNEQARELTQQELLERQQRQEREGRFGKPLLMDEGSLALEDRPPASTLDSYASLRIHALYVFSKALGSLNTKAVLAWANAFVPLPDTLLGLEWIDDMSGVLLFSSPDDAYAALNSLLLNDSLLPGIQYAITQLADIYSEQPPDQLAVLAQPHLARPITVSSEERPTWIRFAKHDDKKASDARSRSKYYAERAAPREARRERDDRPETDLAALDAELDAFAAGEELPARPERRPRASRTDERPARERDRRDQELERVDKRRDRRDRTDELDALDRELEDYAAGETKRRRSLSPKRTRSLSPRRSAEPAPVPNGVYTGVELFATKGSEPTLLQRLSSRPVIPEAQVEYQQETVLQVQEVQEEEEDYEQEEEPQDDVLAEISPALSTPSLFARSNRPAAADLFDEPLSELIPSRKGGMRGWDD